MKAIGFVDYENIWTGLHEEGYRFKPQEFIALLNKYAAYRKLDLQAVYLYANFDKEEFWRTQTEFEKRNIFTRHVYGKNSYSGTPVRKNAADTELMLEVQEILFTRYKTTDLFLLFTGDGGFLPLIRRIRSWGKEVRIIGVQNKTHHSLYPYCESFDVYAEFLKKDLTPYTPSGDLVEGVELIAELQTRLPYVASTKARAFLSQNLGRSTTEIKEFIHYLLNENYLLERELYDPNLAIKKTKIYLLNLEEETIRNLIGEKLPALQARYSRLSSELKEDQSEE